MSKAGEMSRTERKKHNRDRYRRVLSVVDHQTTDKQSPGTSERVVRQILSGQFGQYEPAEIGTAVDAAEQNGDLHVWEDDNGRRRLTPMEEQKLRRVAQYCGRHAMKDELGRVNAAIAEVSADV